MALLELVKAPGRSFGNREKYNVPHISTGYIHLTSKEGTELGKRQRDTWTRVRVGTG